MAPVSYFCRRPTWFEFQVAVPGKGSNVPPRCQGMSLVNHDITYTKGLCDVNTSKLDTSAGDIYFRWYRNWQYFSKVSPTTLNQVRLPFSPNTPMKQIKQPFVRVRDFPCITFAEPVPKWWFDNMGEYFDHIEDTCTWCNVSCQKLK